MKWAMLACVSIASLVLGAPASAASAPTLRSIVAARLPYPQTASQGLSLWLAPPDSLAAGALAPSLSPTFGSNVDAANVQEDTAGGQSEEAIAAAPGGRVMAAWNDITGIMFSPTARAGSITGVGYSTNGGGQFRDLVGLPNANPDQQWSGDPAVVSVDGGAHYIVGSLYAPSLDACFDNRPSMFTVAVAVATPTSSGMTFTPPILVNRPGDLCALFSNRPSAGIALLDKDWLAWDQRSRTLAVSYTRDYLTGPHTGAGQIDISRAHVPANPAQLTTAAFGTPIVVSPERFQVQTGAYVTVAPGGNSYVAWERNIESNIGDGDPYVYEHVALVPAGASAPTVGGPAHPLVVTRGQTPNVGGGVKSLDGECIAGYNRCIGNDFPRIVYDAPLARVIVEWNDASHHPLGDVWLRSYTGSLSPATAVERLNDDSDFTLHMLPAVSVRRDGSICSSWYDRRRWGATSALTDYFGECRAAPAANGSDFRITTGATDWTNTSTAIVPNFGDYTDQTSIGGVTYFTWADGRVGVPQPFVDHH
jgi:hypothetical protein